MYFRDAKMYIIYLQYVTYMYVIICVTKILRRVHFFTVYKFKLLTEYYRWNEFMPHNFCKYLHKNYYYTNYEEQFYS